MPVGVTWPRYLKLSVGAMLSMLAGAQCVHVLYKPLDDLDSLTEQRLKEKLEQQGKEQQKNVV